jgi:para-nitrobenzyl esterase
MNEVKWWSVAGIALAALSSVAQAASTAVRIDSGSLQGAVREEVLYFKGIPFAAPPVGNLRWRPPQPAQKWTAVRQAQQYGADCMQVPFPSDAAPLGVKPAEDCLYLNVWRPVKSTPHEKLPVFVWIYGGGFVNGGSSPAVYDGSAFAKDGIVFVSFNYRLQRFGFFAHPALTAENSGPLGNYGLMDQVAALQWVQRNIAAFGGDPHNVTICGESAGGISVHYLMTSPLAEGLFQKAIVQSGAGRPGGALGMRPLSGGENSAERLGVAFAATRGIQGEGADALAKLREIPADELAKGLNLASMGSDPTYAGGPVIDGKLLTADPAKLYAEGKGARVPMLVGATSMDIGFAFMRSQTIEEILSQFGSDAPNVRTAYHINDADNVQATAFRVGGDQMMIEPARYIARLLSQRGQPVYEFRFSYVAESMRKQWPGAPHASDIPFAFDTVAAKYGPDLTAEDAKAGKSMHAYWAAFARNGKPDVPGLPAWPAYGAGGDTLMDFTTQGPVAGPDPWKQRLDLVARFSDAKLSASNTVKH